MATSDETLNAAMGVSACAFLRSPSGAWTPRARRQTTKCRSTFAALSVQAMPGAILQALDTIDFPTLTEERISERGQRRGSEPCRTGLHGAARRSPRLPAGPQRWRASGTSAPGEIRRRLIEREFLERVGGSDQSAFSWRARALLNSLHLLWQLI